MVVTIHMFGAVVYSHCKRCDCLKLLQTHVLISFVSLTIINVTVSLSPSPSLSVAFTRYCGLFVEAV